ncbi:restriction endonuclease subunit S [Pseudomonas citronellolis]|uniref:restriction endonuclease subunit S n=1 Tax=Pseudomonas citronellolis TaxID=53408 RepID=UPI003AB1078A
MSFPTYPAYKDSGVEWLEEVPTGWTVSKLGYFFREPPCYGVLVPDFDPDGVPMLRITDMEHEFIDASGLVTISASLSAQYARTIVQVGDVVLSLVGTIGKAFEISPKLAGVNLSRAVARIQLNDNTLPRYLCWIFQSCEFTHFIDLVCRGTAQRVLNLSDLNAFSFTFPSYSEQCAISRFLDHETARIDALIEEQQRLIELLKEKRQAVISHAVTKGLDPTVPMKDSGVEWLGKVPAHWDVVSLKRVVVFQRGHDLPSESREEGNVPVISSGGYSGTHSVACAKAPGIVTGRYGSIGQFTLATEDYWPLNTALYSIELYGNKPRYVWYLLQGYAEHFLLNSLKSAVPGVDRNDVHVVKVVAAPVEEQDQIVTYIDRISNQLDQLVDAAERNVTLLQERRSALISAAVTGKIDVRNW